MVRPGSHLAEGNMHFDSDKNHNVAKAKSNSRKKERKGVKRIIRENLTEE